MDRQKENHRHNQHRPTKGIVSSFPKPIILFSSIITLLLTWTAIFEFKRILTAMGALSPGAVWFSRFPLIIAAGILLSVILLGVLVMNSWLEFFQRLWLRLIGNLVIKIIWISGFLAMLAGIVYLYYGPMAYLGGAIGIRLWFYWVLFWAFWAIFLVLDQFRQSPVYLKIMLSVLMVGFAITLVNSFGRITNNPLSASWSEGSVLYYASAFHSQRIYGTEIGLPIINPGRAFLQSILFLIPSLPISAHRIWDALLWLALPLLVGYGLTRRIKLSNPIQSATVILFSLFFLNLGPVYYHLLMVALIVLMGFRADNFWRSLGVVVLASLWAGLTRINWYPMAGSLAAMLYWLEVPSQKKLIKDIWKPLIWFIVGFAAAFLSFQMYVIISGTPADYFENPFNTPLLWYRLFPSATNPTGLLPGIIQTTLPGLICAAIYFFLSGRYHWIRRTGTFGLLLAFLLGGFLVSVRIGGGNNLHNFDAYFVLLLILIVFGLSGRPVADDERPRVLPTKFSIGMAGLLLILPLYKPLSVKPSVPSEIPAAEIQAFHDRTETDILAGQSILLIDEPHLIAFDFWQTPPAAPEFEKVFLMEAAMTGNRTYLDKYYSAITSQEYDFILTEPLSTFLQGSSYGFGEENDVWVKAISKPTFCYYEVDTSFKSLGLDYLSPRETPCDDLNLQP